jgi:DNA-binding transcriptional LysR family regulator
MPSLESTLPNLLAFCRAFEAGSFTAAAKTLRVTPAAVSRAVARLEIAVGATLFRRTTRALRATTAGRAYYERCAAALRLLAEGERALKEEDQDPARGVVRISVPTTYGLRRLLPRLGGFRARHPQIELEIHVSNLNVDFVREGFDLAIRQGSIDDAGMIARKLGDFPLGVFASPRYLARRGTPRTVGDLAAHDCIAFVMPRTGRVFPWAFAAPALDLVPAAALRCVEDPLGGIALATAGEGLYQTYCFLVEGELSRRELAPVLAARGGRTRRFSLIYPKETSRSKPIRAVIDTILELAARDA